MAARLDLATLAQIHPDLRQAIFYETIPRLCTIRLGRRERWNGISLHYEYPQGQNEFRWSEEMVVTRLFDEEVREFICENNIFEISLDQEGESFLEMHFGQNAYFALDHVMIHIGSTGAFAPASHPVLGTGSSPRAMWRHIAHSLRLLQIVATEPTEDTIRPDSPGLAQEISRWHDWVKAYLQRFNTYLKSTAYVEVDVCGSTTTEALVRRYLPQANIMPRSRFAISVQELDLRFTARTFSPWQPALQPR